MDVASRHHLRSDEVDRLTDTVEAELGVSLTGDSFELVELEDSEFDLVLVDGEPLACYIDDRPFLTVRGANEIGADRHVVTVDAGAVSFVSDGADVMRPGIVEADVAISAGDLVVVAEETHGKALAIGEALVDGSEMSGEQGKVVKSRHHVGDDLFELTV
jgi:PUA-domain protein